MSTPGKILLAVALAYAGLAVASLIGGFIVGVIGAALQLSPWLIHWLVWWLPKIIFDDLPCHECGDYGPIYVVEREGHTYDLCHGCAVKAGLKWLALGVEPTVSVLSCSPVSSQDQNKGGQP